MCRSMVDIRSTAAEIRRGKKKKKERNYRAKIYMVSLLHRATIKKLHENVLVPMTSANYAYIINATVLKWMNVSVSHKFI